MTNNKTYQEFILESFDSKPIEWTKRIARTYSLYKFYIDDIEYVVSIDSYFPETYNVIFTGKEPGGISHCHLTNTGNQAKVFITVIDCIRDFIEYKQKTNSPIKSIEFTADNCKDNGNVSARPSIYKRLVQKFIPSNYSANFTNLGHETRFKLTNNDYI